MWVKSLSISSLLFLSSVALSSEYVSGAMQEASELEAEELTELLSAVLKVDSSPDRPVLNESVLQVADESSPEAGVQAVSGESASAEAAAQASDSLKELAVAEEPSALAHDTVPTDIPLPEEMRDAAAPTASTVQSDVSELADTPMPADEAALNDMLSVAESPALNGDNPAAEHQTVLSADVDIYDLESLTPEQAFNVGRLFRAQYRNMEARAYLKYAADRDHVDAAYLYAMELSNYKTTIRTPDNAKAYLVKAAKLGSRKAMRQLYSSDMGLRPKETNYWREKYYQLVMDLVEVDPGQANYELAQYHRPASWDEYQSYIDKAISFSHPQAMIERADRLVVEDDAYLFSFGRRAKAKALYLGAAETDSLPAMRKYISFLEKESDYKEAYKWRVMAFERGDIVSLAVLSQVYIGDSKQYSFVPVDNVKAKAYLELYLDTAGQDRMKSLYLSLEQDAETLGELLSEEEAAEAEELYNKINDKFVFYFHDLYWGDW